MIEQLQTIALVEGLLAQFSQQAPKLGLSFLTLVAGILLGKAVAKATSDILKKVGLDKAARLTGLQTIFNSIGIHSVPSEFIGRLLKYILYILVVMVSFDILGLYMIGSVFGAIIGYLPRVIGSVAILVIGLIISGVFAELVGRGIRGAGVDEVAKGVGVRFGMADLAEAITRYILYIAVAMIALSTLQINTTILALLLTIIAGAVALAGSLLLVLSFRDLGPDLAAGLYLETNRILRPGSKIKFKNISGTIKKAGLVFTTVETRNGIVRIPNKLLLEEEFTVR